MQNRPHKKIIRLLNVVVKILHRWVPWSFYPHLQGLFFLWPLPEATDFYTRPYHVQLWRVFRYELIDRSCWMKIQNAEYLLVFSGWFQPSYVLTLQARHSSILRKKQAHLLIMYKYIRIKRVLSKFIQFSKSKLQSYLALCIFSSKFSNAFSTNGIIEWRHSETNKFI